MRRGQPQWGRRRGRGSILYAGKPTLTDSGRRRASRNATALVNHTGTVKEHSDDWTTTIGDRKSQKSIYSTDFHRQTTADRQCNCHCDRYDWLHRIYICGYIILCVLFPTLVADSSPVQFSHRPSSSDLYAQCPQRHSQSSTQTNSQMAR